MPGRIKFVFIDMVEGSFDRTASITCLFYRDPREEALFFNHPHLLMEGERAQPLLYGPLHSTLSFLSLPITLSPPFFFLMVRLSSPLSSFERWP